MVKLNKFTLSIPIFSGISGNGFSRPGSLGQQTVKVYSKIRSSWSGVFKISLILFSLDLFSLQASAQLEGGRAIPAGGKGNYGLIEGAASGTCDIYGNGPYDLFVGLRTLYPFECFDDYGTPVYGEKVSVKSPNSGGYVFQHTDGEIYALSYSNKQIHLLSFNRNLLEFETIATHQVDKMNSSLTGFIDKQGKLHVFHVSYDDTKITGAGDRPPFPSSRSSRNKDDVPYNHQKEYNAYDGAGLAKNPSVYSRGPRLFHARFSDIKMTKLEINEPVDVESRNCYFKFGCSGLTMAIYNRETKIPQVVGANQTGLTRVFQNISVDGVNINEVRYAVDDTPEHVILRHPVIHPNVKAITNPKNGLSDLLIGDTGRLWFYPLKGMLKDNTPIYGEPKPVMCRSADILCGKLPVVSPGDVNNDGLVDFIVGNDAGELLFVKNIGSKKAPEFANPVPVLIDGKTFRIRAGYQGSIQGPGESNWGYTCPTLYDWNKDGKLDIVMNSILGDIVTFIQIDGKGDRPAFSEMKKIFCEGLDLHLSWRTQPGLTTWGGETEPCIIANDENNEFRCFYRIDIQNVVRGDVLRLETGEAIRAHDKRFVGQWGRSKIVPVDWDKDGKIDLMVGTGRAQSIPGPGGMPDNLEGEERQACVLFMKNVGSNTKPVFAYPVRIKFKGETIKLGTHSCSPAPVDLGRGVLDLVVARESGKLMYYNRENLSSTE